MLKLEEFIEKNKDKIRKVVWNDTVDKMSENIQLTSVMFEKMSEMEYFNISKESILKINKDLHYYVENVLNPTYQIAIIGAIKAGKSTLINALLGHELASVNVTPETATLTKFKSSKKNNIKIKFYSSLEWEEIWNNAVEKKAEIFIDEYNFLNADTVKNKYLNKREMIFEFDNLEQMKEEIHKWTSSQEKEHYFVKEIEIGLENLNLPEQISLVDTPGLNDIIDYRSKITRDYIDSANAVIVCVNAKTLRNDEMVTITKVFSQARHKKDKIYILGTQIDTMNSMEDWEKQRKDWIKHLSTKTCYESEKRAEDHLIGISSYAYSFAKEIPSVIGMDDVIKLVQLKFLNSEYHNIITKVHTNQITEEETERLKNNVIEFSNINSVKEIIEKILLKDYNEALRQDFVERYNLLNSEILNFAERQRDILQQNIKECNLSEEELIRSIEESKKKIEEHEKMTMDLENNLQNTKNSFKIEFDELERNFESFKEKVKNIRID